MGAEFLRRTKPTIKKYVDKNRVALATPDLFTRTPTSISRTALVSLLENNSLCDGDHVIVEAANDSFVVTKNGCIAGKFKKLPQPLVDAINESYGTALGEVIRINRLSKTAEVALS